MKTCLFHDWGRWEQYETIITDRLGGEYPVLRQQRECLRCGHMQDREVSEYAYALKFRRPSNGAQRKTENEKDA